MASQAAPVAPEAEASEGGSFGFGRRLSGGTTVGHSGLRLDVNATRSDGWREATEYNRQSTTLRWDLRLPGVARLRTVAAFSNIDQKPAGVSALSEEDFETDPTLNYLSSK